MSPCLCSHFIQDRCLIGDLPIQSIPFNHAVYIVDHKCPDRFSIPKIRSSTNVIERALHVHVHENIQMMIKKVSK